MDFTPLLLLQCGLCGPHPIPQQLAVNGLMSHVLARAENQHTVFPRISAQALI